MKKINFFGSKFRGSLKGKGFYVALSICIAAVGVAGIAAYNQTIRNLNQDPLFSYPDSSSEVEDVGKNRTDIPLDVSTPDESSLSDEEDALLKALQTNAARIMPVTGEILNVYSNGELVKSETLNVWKTHDGIDIKGDSGTQVRSMTKGTVKEIYEDPLWGTCIVIEHIDNAEGHYYNLGKSITVSVGDEVKSGTIIGTIGDTAEIEAAMASHLHFGLKRNGKWIDPIEYISPGKN